MKIKSTLLIGTLLAMTLSFAHGQDADKGKRKKIKENILKRFDTDGDGKVSEAEKKAHMEARAAQRDQQFKSADKNSDGNLSMEEFKTIPRIVKMAERRPQAINKLFTRMDKDQNGLIEAKEFKMRARGKGKGKGKRKAKRNTADS